MTSVLVLSFSTISRDPRVLREIGILREDYDVHSIGYGPAPEGISSHLQVPDELQEWRADYRHYYALVLSRQYKRLYFGAPWVRFVTERVVPGSFDIVLANDVNAVPLARRLKPRQGVHADLHEYATRQGEESATWNRYVRPVNRWMVTRHVRRADSVTTVSPGLAAEYAREFGIDAGIVPNATRFRPDIEPRPTPTDQAIRLVHTGAAGRSRQLESMIDAVSRANAVRSGSFTFDLYLVAGDRAYIGELESRAEATGGAVRVLNPVPFEQIVPMLTSYDVGVYSCPPANFNQKHALPNKLFEFVQARLAVVIGPSEDMRAYVDGYEFGTVARGFGGDDIATALLDLDPEDIDRMKGAAHAAARTLSSEALSVRWKEAVDRLAGRPDGKATT